MTATQTLGTTLGFFVVFVFVFFYGVSRTKSLNFVEESILKSIKFTLN